MESAEDKRWRLIEAAMAVLQAVPDQQLNIVLLNKALFYLDLIALRDLGDTVTHNTYLALHQGPVIARYPDRLVAALSRAGLAQQESAGMAKPVRVVAPLDSFEFLGDREMAIATDVAQRIAQLSSSRASELSHENVGWQIAYDNGLRGGGRPLPVDMLIALQEVGDRDPWMNEPSDEALDTAAAGADENLGDRW